MVVRGSVSFTMIDKEVMMWSPGIKPPVSLVEPGRAWAEVTQQARQRHCEARPPDVEAEPSAHVDFDTTEARGVECSGIHQGEERDSHREGAFRPAEEFRGSTLLGPRVLCFDGGPRRSCDSGIHQEARERR